MTATQPNPLLVVFGAGASYDSIRKLVPIAAAPTNRPPLASQLFREQYDGYVQRHPACGALVAHLRSLPSTANLEAELDRIQGEEAPSSGLRRRQVVSLRYYLRDVLRDAAQFESHAPAQTNYHLLVEQLLLWQERTDNPIYLVTFNYDTMLEKAIADLTGRPLRVIAEYVETSLKLFKPHGSVSWARVTANERGGRGGYGDAIEQYVLELAASDSLKPTDEFVVMDTVELGIVGEKAVMPGLTVPIQRKNAFEFPIDHQQALAHALASGPGPLKVLTIGWRAGEQHFLEFWRTNHGPSQPRLLCVNGHQEQGVATIEALRNAQLRFSEVHALPGGFSHLLGAPLASFLEAPFGDYPTPRQ